MSNSGLYAIYCAGNDRTYLGSSIDIHKRRIQHFSSLSRGDHGNSFLQRSFNKYGKDTFKFKIIEEGLPNEALSCEQELLDFLFEEASNKLFNIAKDATANMLGRNHSDETKKKIGESGKGRVAWNKGLTKDDPRVQKNAESKKGIPPWNKGIKTSEEVKKKIGLGNKGKIVSEESKKKISDARKGKTSWNKGIGHSKETKRKISISLMNRKKN